MSVAGMLVIYGATYGVLSYLSWREWRDSNLRRRRAELRRLKRINTQPDPPRINTIRRDPSPKPRNPAA